MNKSELIKLLKDLKIPVNEGIQNDTNANIYPRIVFFEYGWEPLVSSGEEYNTKVIYQISFFSNQPRDATLIKLRNILKKNGKNPYIEHEYIEKDKCFHSYFAIEVLEKIE